MSEPEGRQGRLEVSHLTVAYDGTSALDDVSLQVTPGEVLAVLGPSGCGKSTLLRTIAGLERAQHGVVSYDGRDLAGVPPHRRGFALLFQDGQLFGHQSVARNIGYPMRLRHRPRAEVTRRVGELLELVGLTGKGDRMPGTLSGGEQQRVALARALAVEPRLLLLDEPLSALDRALREELAGSLREILRAAGTTAIMVTHDQEEAFAVADTMALLRAGRLVQQGSIAEVWSSPADAWAAVFLGYDRVLEGEPALVVRRAAEPEATWTRVAVRRSALRLDEAGPLEGRVLSVRATPSSTRIALDVVGVGAVEGVAEPGAQIKPGERVRLSVERSRVAPLGEYR